MAVDGRTGGIIPAKTATCSILLSTKQHKFRQYSEAFNFFQSKSVNNIIGNRKLEYVIHFRDLEILDDQTEYIKRYYNAGECASRSRKLISKTTMS